MRVDIHTTTQKYRVIYADPPRKFSSKEAFESRNGGSGFVPLEAVYPTMTTADLKALDVGRLAEKDAALFMWATDAHLPDAFELFEAWGFRYVTVAFVWSKKTTTGKNAANLAPPGRSRIASFASWGRGGAWYSIRSRTTSGSSSRP